MHDFMSYFLFVASVIFAVNQVEKSIARRTADEIERRSKPSVPTPKRDMREWIGPLIGLACAIYLALVIFHPWR